ncbi:uncharacterized mitochondrial protein AtMg00310-like [Primulina eburnea]|uniref:uncharacterized mitochondrial protein AtMg00310-like n=1 Tax=Primulina eburnea TaxID=1245227 RepID=UPI003C6C3EB9
MLSLYEKASGQLINFDKSALSFSPNTTEDEVNTIKQMLSVRVVQGHDLYLGLPTFSTRQKKMQFQYLIERIVERIKGWGSKTYSAGGKEILIKSVLQSIPSYAMSCFRIPKSILEAIEKECSDFWWGKVDEKKRMHWKKWNSLCKPKCLGGMGFRHMEAFNKALLAKQIWRLMTMSDSMVVRVLKARYFKHQDIMKATIESNPSFIWRSLLWSRQLIEKGLSWRVGNGQKIQTFRPSLVSLIRV